MKNLRLRHGLSVSLMLLLSGLAIDRPASGDSLASCSAIDRTDGPKVVLSKLEFRDSSGATRVLNDELEIGILLALKARFGNLFSEAEPSPVICSGRAPRSDGSDFTSNLVKVLNGRDVLLEVWGTVKEGGSSDDHTYGGSFYMVVVPVRHYEGVEKKLDFHMLRYPNTPRGEFEDACLSMVFGTEFEVYTSIANGMKALKDGRYDAAKSYIAGARLSWKKSLADGTLAETATDEQQVLGYIIDLEEEIVSAARADTNYAGDLVAIEEALVSGGQ